MLGHGRFVVAVLPRRPRRLGRRRAAGSGRLGRRRVRRDLRPLRRAAGHRAAHRRRHPQDRDRHRDQLRVAVHLRPREQHRARIVQRRAGRDLDLVAGASRRPADRRPRGPDLLADAQARAAGAADLAARRRGARVHRASRDSRARVLITSTTVPRSRLSYPQVHPQVGMNHSRVIPVVGCGRKRPRLDKRVSAGERRRDAAGQRQRVVMRNPMKAMPKPITRFQPSMPGIGRRHAAQVEDEDPDEPDQHEADHHGLEPDGIGGRFALVALDELLVFARSCHGASLPPARRHPADLESLCG